MYFRSQQKAKLIKIMIKVLHNPRCGKSRNCIAHLDQLKIPYQIVKYLDNTLSIEELEELLTKLGKKPIDIVRTKEPIWTEQYKGKSLTDKDIINALHKHPILIERPIVIGDKQAVIARDLSQSEELFNKVLANQY
jgi:arsenate reductase